MNLNDKVIASDGSINGWAEIFKNTPPTPGGVLIIFGGEQVLDHHVAGWHLTMMSLLDENNTPIYNGIGHQIPNGLSSRDIEKDIRSYIYSQLIELSQPIEVANSISTNVFINSLSQRDGATLIHEFEKISAGCAISVSCAHLYRFPEITSKVLATTNSWTGLENQFITREDEYFSHLMELARRLLSIAEQQNLFVVLFCEEYSPVLNKLPEDLQQNPNLAIIDMPDVDAITKPSLMFEYWLSQAKLGNIDQIIDEIRNSVDAPENQALIISKILYYDQQFLEAWNVIEPHLALLQKADAKLLLSICQTAISAGKRDSAIDFLTKSVSQGLDTLSDIHTAYTIANILALHDVASSLFDRIYSEYPEHPVALETAFQRAFASRNYVAANNIAQKLQDDYLAQLSLTLGRAELNFDTLFSLAKERDRLHDAYAACAQEALARNLYSLSAELVGKIPDDSKLAIQAIQIRIDILKVTISDYNFDTSYFSGLEAILSFVASHPHELDSRVSLEAFLEENLGERLSLVHLSFILLNRLHNAVQNLVSLEDQNRIEHNTLNSEDSEFDEEQVSHFWEELTKSFSDSGVFIGKGQIPNAIREFVSPTLLDYFMSMLTHSSQEIRGDEDIDFLNLLLHTICLICREIDDPVNDFRAIHHVIGRLTQAGYHQKARDLGEHAVATISMLQNERVFWRMGQAWWCYAEAYQRTGNLLAALRCLCLCSVTWDDAIIDLHILGNYCRLAARIYRDLGLQSLAKQAIELEKRVGSIANYESRLWHQLRVTELSVKMSSGLNHLSIDELQQLLEETHCLVAQEQDELIPLLSVMGGIIRAFNIKNVEVPLELISFYHSKLDAFPTFMRSQLESIVNIAPSKDELIQSFKQCFVANYLDDAAYQIRSLQVAARTAVRTACEGEDAELFLAASIILTQPALSFSIHQRRLDNSINKHQIYAWISNLSSNEDGNTQQILDSNNLLHESIVSTSELLTELDGLSLDHVQRLM